MICKLCIFQTMWKLGSNHIWRCFWFLHWQKRHLQRLASYWNFSLLVCKLSKSGLWIIHYILKMSRYANIVFLGSYLVPTCIERFIWTVCCFFSYICWSVNCMSSVSKFNNFFVTCMETKSIFIFESFNIVCYGKFVFDSPILFLIFFIWSLDFFKGLFQSLCQSVNCMSGVFES